MKKILKKMSYLSLVVLLIGSMFVLDSKKISADSSSNTDWGMKMSISSDKDTIHAGETFTIFAEAEWVKWALLPNYFGWASINLPEGLTYVSGVSTQGNVDIYASSGNSQIRLDFGWIAAFNPNKVEIKVRASDDVKIGSTLTTNMKSDESPNKLNLNINTRVIGPSLQAAKTSDRTGTTLVGDSVTYTITAKNVGNENATLSTIEDTLPQGVSVDLNTLKISVNGGSEYSPSASINSNILNIQLGTIKPNDSVRIKYTATITNDAFKKSIENTGKLTGSYTDSTGPKTVTSIFSDNNTTPVSKKVDVIYHAINDNSDQYMHESVYGDTYTFLDNTTTNFEKTGYTLKGWSKDLDGATKHHDFNELISVAPFEDTHNLYANWQANNYKVTYDGNNATSGQMLEGDAEFDQSFALPEVEYKKTGYTFMGWDVTLSDGSEFTLTDEEVIATWNYTEDLTLVANWEANNYKVTYDGNDETSGQMLDGDAEFDQSFALPEVEYKKTGYTFMGWDVTLSDGSEFTLTDEEVIATWNYTEDLTLIANWKANNYNIKYNGNGATSGSMLDELATYDEKTTLSLSAFEKEGYTFVGWSTTKDGKVEYKNEYIFKEWKLDHDLELYAVWAKVPASISSAPSKETPKASVNAGDTTNIMMWTILFTLSLGFISIKQRRSSK